MTLVVDASVALRWLAQGGDNSAVDALFKNAVGMGGDQLLIAPALVILEVHNSLAKLWNRGLVDVRQLDEGAARVSVALQVEPVDSGLTLAASALSMTAETAMGRPPSARTIPFNIYDCLYIALAQRWSAELVTADERQSSVASGLGCRVRLIGS
jgi:predicted nucleic acid-binding protein